MVQTGDRVPSATLMEMTADGPRPVLTDELFRGRTVALFAVPGAFTPVCSARHLPSFVEKAGELRSKGVDEIVGIAVNDPFVMKAWGEATGVGDRVRLLADGNAEFSTALGLTMDGSKFGLGTRSQRFSMLVKDGTIVQLNVEEPGAYKVSSAEALLSQLAA